MRLKTNLLRNVFDGSVVQSFSSLCDTFAPVEFVLAEFVTANSLRQLADASPLHLPCKMMCSCHARCALGSIIYSKGRGLAAGGPAKLASAQACIRGAPAKCRVPVSGAWRTFQLVAQGGGES